MCTKTDILFHLFIFCTDALSCPVTYDLVSDPVYETPSSHLSVSTIYREYDSIGSLIARYGANKSRLTNVGWRARSEQAQHIQAEFLANRIVTGICQLKYTILF